MKIFGDGLGYLSWRKRPKIWLWRAFPLAVLFGIGALAWAAFFLRRDDAGEPLVRLLVAFIPLHGVAVGVLVLYAFCDADEGGLAALELAPPQKASLRVQLWLSALAVVLYLPFSIALSALTIVALQPLGFEATPSPLFDYMTLDQPALFAVALIGVAVVAPIGEEILFRMAMVDYFKLVGLPWPAICTALIFSFIHGQVFAIPALFLLSLVLQAARKMSSGLYAPIFIHAFYNLFSTILYLAFGGR